LSSVHNVETSPGDLPAFYSVGIEFVFPGLKWPGREADLSSSSVVEIKNAWNAALHRLLELAL